MRMAFVESVLLELVRDGTLAPSDSVIAVCATVAERDLFARRGFSNVLLTSLEQDVGHVAPYAWRRQDAQRLEFPDGSFDFAFVADGLHHCASPHRALLEMYRVSAKGIVVFESRDNVLTRLATRLGLSPDYELEAVVDNDFSQGGVDNTQIPNYVYRWTEAELRKTIASAHPVGPHRFRFFHSLELPYDRTRLSARRVKRWVVTCAAPVVRLLTRVLPGQCNAFATVVLKPRIPDDLWPWLRLEAGEVVFDREYAQARFHNRAPSRPTTP
jgi:SAM-dependent methyltransferase